MEPATLVGVTVRELTITGLIVRDAEEVAPLKMALMVAVVCTLTGTVAIVKLADICPAATATVVGTVAEPTLLASETTNPFDPAGPLRTTVPVEVAPPCTVAEFRFKDTKLGAKTESDAVELVPFNVAVKVADSLTRTPKVETAKGAEVFPGGTVTDAGTVTSEVLDFSEIVRPEGPAGSLSDTVPVVGLPPTTSDGLRETDSSFAGLTVNVAVRETLLRVAVITDGMGALTAEVEIVKVPLVAPDGMMKVDGTVAALFPLESVIDVPDAAAGPDRVTVPVDGFPPTNAIGFREKDWRTAGWTVRVAVSVPELRVAVITDWIKVFTP